jgi:hypothetical protein
MNNLQDLVEEFHSFCANSRAHADFFLRNGRLHPEAHHVIQARLANWVRRLETARPEVREKLLVEIEAPAG